MLGADFPALVERLDREAEAVRGKAAHHREQGDLAEAAIEDLVEINLRTIARVVAALDDDEDLGA